jgi:hypothetical protein
MENSLRWLKENGLIAEKSGRFAQTQKGSDLVSFHGRATIRETWLRVEDAVREMISSSED